MKNKKTTLVGSVCQCFNYQCGEKNGVKWQFCYHNRTATIKKKKVTQKFKFIIKNDDFIEPQNPKIFFCYIASVLDVSFEESVWRDKNGNLNKTRIIVAFVLVTAKDHKLTEKDIEYYDDKKKYLTSKVDFDNDDSIDDDIIDDDIFDNSFDADNDFPF